MLNRLDNIESMLFCSKVLLTVEEAALYLGITKSGFYKVARKYNIKCSRPTNGKKYFKKEDLDEWLSTSSGDKSANKSEGGSNE
jgi:excisionase family DNA binding protein